MSRAARWGTLVVLGNLLVNIVHGEAHRQLEINLNPHEEMFVYSVIVVAPVVAMILMWISRRRWGPLLLTVSMAGSLLFGGFKHFVVMSSDHVSQVPAGVWGSVFVVTSYLLLVAEALGVFTGVYLLRGDNRL
jgi:hypothetical protein